MQFDDAAAVAKARTGDHDAFRVLVDRHSRSLYRLAFRMTGRAEDAEDVVQETFIRAYRQLSRFEAREAREAALAAGLGGTPYDLGSSLLSRRDYDRAIARFDQVIEQKGARADAAMYRKAYALYRLGRSSDATATLAALKRDYPKSAYLKDASVLEAAVRESAGQPMRPEQADADELKLLALNALPHTDPERALPLLEGVLNGANSLQLKQRAIFVLAQSTQPRARQILMDLAKGGGNPDLQRYAIRCVATGGKQGATTAELLAIYDAAQDTDVKRAGQNNGEALVAIARKETDMSIKREIVSRLSTMSTNKAAMDSMLEIIK